MTNQFLLIRFIFPLFICAYIFSPAASTKTEQDELPVVNCKQDENGRVVLEFDATNCPRMHYYEFWEARTFSGFAKTMFLDHGVSGGGKITSPVNHVVNGEANGFVRSEVYFGVKKDGKIGKHLASFIIEKP